MRKSRLTAFVFLSVFFLSTSCLTPSDIIERDYGTLVTAVMNAPNPVKGVYPGNLPPDFSSSTFLQVIKSKIPENSFLALSHYRLEVIPKGSYYLLIVREPATGEMILFDYSCTFNVDGPVFHAPGQYDLNHLEWYDPCKSPPR